MMTSRERVRRALRREKPDRAPRELWALPGVEMFRKDEKDALLAQYPSDFAAPDVTTGAGPDVRYGTGYRTRGTPNMIGTYVDEWGCPFTVAEHGVIGEVKEPPLAEWSALETLRPPDEILVMADFSSVDAACAETDKYVKAGTTVRPFERMQFLRGSENLYHGPGVGVGGGDAAARHGARVFPARDRDVGEDGRGRDFVHGRLGQPGPAADFAGRCGGSCSSRCTASMWT